MSVKSIEYAGLLTHSATDLRSEQDRERIAAEKAASEATGQSSFADLVTGRRRQYTLHLDEALRAFREGEEATEELVKRRWYARSVLEYRDARRAAGEDLREGPSILQTVSAGGKALSEAAGSLWDAIPGWVKWGAAGAGALYAAAHLLPGDES